MAESRGLKRWILLYMAVFLFLGMPALRVQAQEPQPVPVGVQDETQRKLPGYEQAQVQELPGEKPGAAQERPDEAYLAAWEAVADSFASQSEAFWTQQEAALRAAGLQSAADFARQQKEEAAGFAAALQNALAQLAAVASEGDEVRLAAREQVEAAASAAVSEFASASAELASMQPAGTEGTTQPVSPGEAAQLNPVFTSLTGKKVSILGDSITTFQGYIPAGYTCYYPRANNDIKDVNDTWWMKVINRTGMQLLVNNAWSGSAVCGDSRAENSSAGCSNRRLVELMGADGTVPDVILVYLGANDFFHPMTLGTWSGQATHRTDHYILDFTEAYELMLQKLRGIYPNTQIYCMTLIEANSGDHPRVNANGDTIADYNRRIREIAAAHGIPVIDVHECGIPVYELNRYTSDGTHPNREGAERMAAYVTNALLAGG